MTEQEEQRQRSWTTPSLWAALVVLSLASSGPVAGLASRGVISPEAWDAVAPIAYAPLVWISEHTSFFEDHSIGRAYMAYIEWWIN